MRSSSQGTHAQSLYVLFPCCETNATPIHRESTAISLSRKSMLPERPVHRTRATIDLNQLAINFKRSREFIGRDLQYMAVVKANAYGHGAVDCSRRLEAEGADWFGVAIPEEGVELRKAGITKPIL